MRSRIHRQFVLRERDGTVRTKYGSHAEPRFGIIFWLCFLRAFKLENLPGTGSQLQQS